MQEWTKQNLWRTFQNLKWYGLLKQIITSNFKGFFLQILLGPLLNTLSPISLTINELNVDWQSHRSGSHQKSFHKNKLLPKFYTYWTKTDIRHQFKIWFESFCEWENLQLSWVFFGVIVVTCKPVKKVFHKETANAPSSVPVRSRKLPLH